MSAVQGGAQDYLVKTEAEGRGPGAGAALRHRAPPTPLRAEEPLPHRRPHWALQPARLRRPGRAVPEAGPAHHARRHPRLPGPRPLQDHQRHPRPPRGRPGPAEGCRDPEGRLPPFRYHRPHGRRRVRRAGAGVFGGQRGAAPRAAPGALRRVQPRQPGAVPALGQHGHGPLTTETSACAWRTCSPGRRAMYEEKRSKRKAALG